jgi:hypothetical protein
VLALVFSFLVVLYLIVPDAIFRFVFKWFVPLRTLVPAKPETIYRAVVLAIIPFVIAMLLVWYVPLFNAWPFSVEGTAQERRADYKVVTSALYSDAQFRELDAHGKFWPALTRCSRRQARLLFWLYLSVIGEGLFFGFLSGNYGKYQRNRFYRLLADGLLLPNISEWHVLLTPFVFRDKKVTVSADILCTDNTLYNGEISQYFLDGSKMSGMILVKPRRYDRRAYLIDLDKGLKPDKTKYWKDIPSAKLYIFADKILNINLNYLTSESLPGPVKNFIAESIGDSQISITVTVKKSGRGGQAGQPDTPTS